MYTSPVNHLRPLSKYYITHIKFGHSEIKTAINTSQACHLSQPDLELQLKNLDELP